MKKVLIFLCKLIISGIISIGILSVFTYFYKYTGVHIKNGSKATDYKWEPNQVMSTMVEGFARFKMDKNGFNNAICKDENPDILVMGSSHMEAAQMQPDENVAYLLNMGLPNYYTYNIGTSGHTIYNCVKNIKNAVDVYKPNKYIIIETSLVDLNVNDMKKVINDTYPTIQSYDSGILYEIQRTIPAVKELYKSVDDWREVGKNNNESKKNTQDKYNEEYVEVLNQFISKASQPINQENIELIIVYHPGTFVDKDGVFQEQKNLKAIETFENACNENGVKFINMTSDFKKLYENEKILAHGFSNTSVGSGHLNKYGHKEIANRLIDYIKKNEEDSNGSK